MELNKNSDHDSQRTFNLVSNGYQFVSMTDLISFLENNGFYPKTNDLEAILRRCDHDADRALSQEEFEEVMGHTEELFGSQ